MNTHSYRMLRTILVLLGLLLLVSSALLASPPTVSAQAATATAPRCFEQTGGYCIAGRIRQFWERTGGESVLGFPISTLRYEWIEGQWRQVQWFERARLELHPENPPPFDVLPGRLGVERLAQQGRDWQQFAAAPASDGCIVLAGSPHPLCEPFLSGWRNLGLELDGQRGYTTGESLALLGVPISSPQWEQINGVSAPVQWFERGRLELYDEGGQLRLKRGLLGSELFPLVWAPVPRIEWGACPDGAQSGVRCGNLIVAQDRNNPRERTLSLAVAFYRTGGANPAPDPVVYLSGGPGSGAIAEGLSGALAQVIGNRDLIVIDQRGTGYSQPSLSCSEIIAMYRALSNRRYTPTDRLNSELNALLDCRDRLAQEGVDLTNINSAASAADLDELRRTLGYSQWNLVGISYGTRLALTAMRDYPLGIRSAVLDSVYPTQVSLYTAMPDNMQRAFQLVFDSCAADAACNARYPDLANTFTALIEQLEREPITVLVPNYRTGERTPQVFDAARFIEAMYRASYRTYELGNLPALIHTTYNGDHELLADWQARRFGGGGGGPGYSHAMYYAVQCNEELPFTPLSELQAASNRYPSLQPFFSTAFEFTEQGRTLCQQIGTATPDSREDAPVVSDIPTLLLAGQRDPITPPAWAWLAAQTLSRSYVYEFRGIGHAAIFSSNCSMQITRSFLNQPAASPDATCLR